MKIYDNVSHIVGKTPLVYLNNYVNRHKLAANICAKVEYFNPAGSVKDRAALNMIEEAEQKGLLKKGSIIVEPTSGNTGIALAAFCAVKGYRVVLTMPETMSIERRKLLKAYGAELVLTDGKDGMNGAIKKAEEICRNNDNAILAGQFINPANPLAHYKTTAPEIYNDTDGKIDVFVGGIGSGGTITGIGRYLKEKNPDIKIIGVEPLSSPFLTNGTKGAHKIQGIGAGFKPDNLDLSVVDEIVTISDEDAINTAKEIISLEGMLVGISSGAAVKAAALLAKRMGFESKLIVVLLPDSGDRYLSTEIFE